MIIVLIMYLLLGLAFTLGKGALDYSAPIFFVGIRMTIAGALLLGYQYFFDRSRWRFDKKDLGLFLLISFFHVYLTYILEFWGLQYITAAKDSFLFSFTPFMTALFEYFRFSEPLTSKKWVGLFIGFLGILPVLISGTPIEEVVGSFFIFSYPELAVLGAVASAAFAWILIKGLVHKNKYTPIMINGVAMFMGGVGALITSLLFEKKPLLKFPPGATESFFINNATLEHVFGAYGAKFLPLIIYLVILILIANFLFYNIYVHLLKKYTATFLSFVGFTTPLFTAFFDWIIFGETISYIFFVSVFIVGFGLYIFYQDELKPNAKPQTS